MPAHRGIDALFTYFAAHSRYFLWYFSISKVFSIVKHVYVLVVNIANIHKNIYFNGLLGTMLGYSFAESYLVTVEPSYRFAVNSFTKSDFYLNSYPSSFMVTLGIAYNFK